MPTIQELQLDSLKKSSDSKTLYNIVIVGGAGASGRHLAALLIAQGHAVTIIDPAVPTLRQIGGLKTQYADAVVQTLSFADTVLFTPQELQEQGRALDCDLVICTTKAFSMDGQLAKFILKHTSPKAPVLSLTTGVLPQTLPAELRLNQIKNLHDFTDQMQEQKREPLVGVINYPSTKTADGVKVGATQARVAEVGISLAQNPAAPKVCEILSNAKVGSTIKDSAAEVIFGKLGDMLSVGPQALLDTTFLDAVNPATLTGEISTHILSEFHSLLVALKLPHKELPDFIKSMQEVMQKKGPFKGSMHPDLQAGSLTENKATYGALSELAQGLKLSTPYLAKTSELLSAVESQQILLSDLRQEFKKLTSAEGFSKFQIPDPQGAELVMMMEEMRPY